MSGTLGIVILAHTALDRVAQVARFWARAGCPVVIHLDKAVDRAACRALSTSLADSPDVGFSPRHRCEWGTWGLVAATQDAATQILARHPAVRHVYLTSGACLPLRPARDLIRYLDARPHTDFIESAATSDVPWTVGGLEMERFTLHFPFPWRRRRGLFDRYVALQRALGVTRAIPPGIAPHMGSQWWCLTRRTLSAILEDPRRAELDRYFRKVWIPDESYFQSLARLWSEKIESRSLTLSKFDLQGKPHVFYDDHLHLLRRSDCFVARKVWPHATRLYDEFLSDNGHRAEQSDPNPAKIDRVFARALERGRRGRPGKVSQGRYPRAGREAGPTAARYAVFHGFSEVFADFGPWLARSAGATVHGHLFAADRVQFAGGATMAPGAICDLAGIRDANPTAFLQNLVWNARGTRQCFLFGPRDRQAIAPVLARDPNCELHVVTGAWAITLFRTNDNFGVLRAEAGRLQKIEETTLRAWQAPDAAARVRVWTLAEFLQAPMETMLPILDHLGPREARHLTEAPRLHPLDGFPQFLQNLRNMGMQLHLTGDFALPDVAQPQDRPTQKPVLVNK